MGHFAREFHFQAALMVLAAWSVTLLKHVLEPSMDAAFIQAWNYIVPVGWLASGVWACIAIRRTSEPGKGCSRGTQTPDGPSAADLAEQLRDSRRESAGLEQQLSAQRSALRESQRELESRLREEIARLQSRQRAEEQLRLQAERSAEELQAQLDTLEGPVGCGPLFSVAHLSPPSFSSFSSERPRPLQERTPSMASAATPRPDAAAESDEVEELQRKVAHLSVALATKDSEQQELAQLREEHLKRARETARQHEAIASLQTLVAKLRARCREAEETSATTSEVADALKHQLVVLASQAGQDAAELADLRGRLGRLTAGKVEEATSVPLVEAWEREVRSSLSHTLELLAKRRTELEVQEAVRRSAEADDRGAPLCKICYERGIECALLPCKHHAFCKQCAGHVVRTSRKCPFCRQPAVDIFETFLG